MVRSSKSIINDITCTVVHLITIEILDHVLSPFAYIYSELLMDNPLSYLLVNCTRGM